MRSDVHEFLIGKIILEARLLAGRDSCRAAPHLETLLKAVDALDEYEDKMKAIERLFIS